jgi:Uma2 family endonuclease
MVTASRSTPVLLQNGDRMTRVEFHRRYSELPDIRAELIEGVVYLSSPLPAREHGKPHALVMAWVGAYWEEHADECEALDNATLFLDTDNEVQPNSSSRWRPAPSRSTCTTS